MLWQLVTKKHPYIGMKQMDIVKHVVHDDKRLPLPEEAHPILRDLMSRCWIKIPKARPKFELKEAKKRILVPSWPWLLN